MAREKILVVDDEPHIVELCVSMLEEEGYQVTGVTHGLEAIRCAQGTSFDVLLVDMVMPDPDGLETFREIRKIDLNTSGVAMTGQGSMEMAVNALNLGFSAFVPKPFSPHQLTQAIREVLEKRRLLQENARLQTIASLYRANQNLTAQTSLADLAACTVQMACEQSGADSASLMLLEGDYLKVVASEGLPADIIRTARKRLGEPIAGYVATQDCSLILNSQDRSSPFASWLTRPHITSALCLPLRSENQPLGVLNLNKYASRPPFTPGDADLLHILTLQAGLALERLQLAEKRLQEEKLAAIGRVVSNLVHDMRSPLGIIRASAEMLQAQDEANQPLTHIIIRESDHLMEMAQDVLDFARGEGNLCLEPGLVKDLVEEAVYSLRRQFEPDRVAVEAQVDYGGLFPMDARKMRPFASGSGRSRRP